MAQINHIFNEKKDENKFLICAHRGSFGGAISQNTLAAFNLAIDLGADIVEMDVIRSTDGEFFVFHDTEEKRLLGIDNNIQSYTAKEISTFRYINRYGLKTKHKVERLEYVLEELKGRGLINLDRCFRRGEQFFLDVLKMVQSLGMEEQIIIKAPANDDIYKWLEKVDFPVMFVPIITNISQIDKYLKKYKNTIALEIVFQHLDSPLLDKDLIRKLSQEGYILWVNSLSIDDNYPLAAGFDDEISLNNSYDKGWGFLVKQGFGIIQTDWVFQLKQYRSLLTE